MKTKFAAGKGNVVAVKRALIEGAIAAVAVGGIALVAEVSTGPAVVLAIAGLVSGARFVLAKVAEANRQRLGQEACNWHLAEEHLFLDGQPFAVEQGEQVAQHS